MINGALLKRTLLIIDCILYNELRLHVNNYIEYIEIYRNFVNTTVNMATLSRHVIVRFLLRTQNEHSGVKK